MNPASSYFHLLGISSAEGKIRKDGQSKFRQINKFIETIKSLDIKSLHEAPFTIYDMGSGKGYLSFALYDYLVNIRHISTQLTGIEIREDLVGKCNDIAQQCQFSGLNFLPGFIEATTVNKTDMLIALHACDTATDDAIAKGVKAGAKYIICSPCCHKQIRPQLKPENGLAHITQYGILKERYAEMLTDTIRALILESQGYKTKIMEYVSTEHTPKNLLIIAVKRDQINDSHRLSALNKIAEIKSLSGIEKHHLESLLK